VSGVLQDLRYAARQLVRSPGFTIAAVLTLALGIGVTATVFSVVNAFLFRPLPVKDGQDLVVVGCRHESTRSLHVVSYDDYLDLRGQVAGLSGLAGYTMRLPGLSADGRAERVVATYVTANYFDVLGVPPGLGRLFTAAQHEGPGAAAEVVLGHRYWQRRFGADPAVLGRPVSLNGHPVTVVGVAPATFRGVYSAIEADLYVLLGAGALTGDYSFGKRDSHDLHAVGRRDRASSLDSIQASLDVVAQRLAAQHPASNKDVTFQVVPETHARPEEAVADQAPLVAGVFSVLVGLVLLVACVNVANLLFVRGTARAHEMALRAALGASAGRLRRQLLTETLLLAALGGGAGALLGAFGARALSGIRIVNLPLSFDFSMDWRVFAAVATTALFSAVGAGFAPAWRSASPDVVSGLRAGGRGGVEGRHRLRDALVTAQIVVCTVLLLTAGLFARSLQGSRAMDLGFQVPGVLNVGMNVAQIGYDEARGRAFYDELERRAQALPGVVSASTAYAVPLGYYSTGLRAAASPGELADKLTSQDAYANLVSPAYFETLGMKLREGRGFLATDVAGADPVAVINEELARRLWPGQSPLGRTLALDRTGHPLARVVGVVPTGRYAQLFEEPRPAVFLPLAQAYEPQRVLHVKVAGAPDGVLRQVQDTIRELDPALPVFDVGTLEASLEGGNGFFFLRLGAALAGTLGLLGLVLSLVGVYGVVAFTTSRRTREIGVRIALGARPAQIARLVVRHSLALAAAGLLGGAVVGLLATRALRGLLVGVSPYDPVTFLVVGTLLSLTVVAASLMPARRAARLDPMHALRGE
jgi:macrolide transport system ATP-binding/permease protein